MKKSVPGTGRRAASIDENSSGCGYVGAGRLTVQGALGAE